MESIAFYLLSVLAIFSALAAVFTRSLVQSILWFAAVLLCVAGFLAILGAPFLAIGQLVIFVGGLISLLLFGIMFNPEDASTEVRIGGAQDGGAREKNQFLGLRAIVALALLLSAGLVAFGVGSAVYGKKLFADFHQFSVLLFTTYWEAVLIGVFALFIALATAVFFLAQERDTV